MDISGFGCTPLPPVGPTLAESFKPNRFEPLNRFILMKLIATFKISRAEYRVNGDGPEVFERLDRALEVEVRRAGRAR